MPDNPVGDEQPQLRRLQDWWLGLPLSYRVNALLYLLGGCALLFLVVSLAGGGAKGHPIQVGAGATTSSTAAKAKAAPVTSARATPTSAGASSSSSSTTTTVGGGSSTTVAAGGTGGSGGSPSGGGSSGQSGGGSGGGTPGGGGGGSGGGGSSGAPSDTTPGSPSDPSPPPTVGPPATSGTTPPTSPPTSPPTTTPACRNSQNSGCGTFSWDPAPDQNQGLTVAVSIRNTNPRVGDTVTFDVTVDDPDHVVSDNCSQVRYGDGATDDGPCSAPPDCPPHYGPWTPPAKQVGHYTHTYTHVYQGAATFPAKFTFKSWGSTCLALDPYASVGETQVMVTIAP